MQANNQTLPVIEVISSSKLNEKEKTEIEKKSTDIFGVLKADFKYSEDKSIIGGFVVKYGSRVCDMSVKGKLSAL